MHTPFDKCQLCVCLGESSLASLQKEVERASQWADLVEIRLDKLKTFDFLPLKRLAQQFPCPILWSLRKSTQGGHFAGSQQEQYKILSSLLHALQPEWVDIEADTPQAMVRELQALSPQTKWVISCHDHKETPVGLETLYQKVTSHKGDYYKIATYANKTTDALRMLNFARQHNQRGPHLAAICMGELGQATRILSPLVSEPFTFASLEKGKETAPGQLTAEELCTLYRFKELDLESQFLGLIGRPIDKGTSHLVQNGVMRELGIKAVYVKFQLQDEELSPFFEELRTLPVRGLSVTMPFKSQVLPFIELSHDLAACNTLAWTHEGIKGSNTDGIGAIRALGLSSLQNEKIVILGAGGTAKAIAYQAHKFGAKVAILNRSVDKAKRLAEPLNAIWGHLDELPTLTEQGYRCIIQATSVGMYPGIEERPIPVEWLPEDSLLLDVVHNPRETRLLKEHKRRGGTAIPGLELFINQAAEQYVCWFGSSFSSDQMEPIIRRHVPPLNQAKSVRVKKSQLKGNLTLPPSKSHSIRAVLLGAMATGTSYVYNLLESPDVARAIQAAKQLGAKISSLPSGLAISGVAGYPQTPAQVIDAGNSGQVLRFAAALAALSDGYAVLTGDDSICNNRVVQPLIDGLRGLKGWAVSSRENGCAPLIVKGPLQPGSTSLSGEDSQPVSALLMASAFLEGTTHMQVSKAGEKPWIALTLAWLERLGVDYSHQNLDSFVVHGKRKRPAFKFTIPGDLSSIAFPVAAALMTRSLITIEQVDLNDCQGDKELLFLLQKMGAHFLIDEERKRLTLLPTGQLVGQVIDVNDFIDAVPVLAVLGTFAEGETLLVNANIARKKECNRLASMTTELTKMGASIEETEDGLKIRKSKLKGALVSSHDDHRLAMSLIVAGLSAEGETEVQGIDCICKSYPTFMDDMRQLGANL